MSKLYINRIGGVMVSVLASSVVDRGFESRSDLTRNYKIGTKEKEQIGWLGIRIMWPSGAAYLSVDCWFSELAL
jgi:hypothetical protein